MTSALTPQRGDVESVEYADADARGDQVAIRLHGHPYRYLVRVSTSAQSGPQLAELTIKADPGHAVDYDAVRAIPVRRLAYSAAGWIDRVGGQVGLVGDYPETRSQPENADARLTELPWRIESAIMRGEPVRRTVAADLGISTATLDRMIRKARDEGLLEGITLPNRPQPRQRDTTEETQP